MLRVKIQCPERRGSKEILPPCHYYGTELSSSILPSLPPFTILLALYHAIYSKILHFHLYIFYLAAFAPSQPSWPQLYLSILATSSFTNLYLLLGRRKPLTFFPAFNLLLRGSLSHIHHESHPTRHKPRPIPLLPLEQPAKSRDSSKLDSHRADRRSFFSSCSCTAELTSARNQCRQTLLATEDHESSGGGTDPGSP